MRPLPLLLLVACAVRQDDAVLEVVPRSAVVPTTAPAPIVLSPPADTDTDTDTDSDSDADTDTDTDTDTDPSGDSAPTGDTAAAPVDTGLGLPAAHSSQCLQITGPADAVRSLGDAGIPTGLSSRTLELWLQTSSPDGWLLGWGTYTTSAASMLILQDGVPTMTNLGNSERATVRVDDGAWHHLAVTLDETNGGMAFYVDGQPAGEPIFGLNTPTAGQVVLGNTLPGMVQAPVVGWMSEVRVWDRARTSEQILARRDVHLAGEAQGLVLQWALDEAGGSTATNRVGDPALDGALEGDAAFGPCPP